MYTNPLSCHMGALKLSPQRSKDIGRTRKSEGSVLAAEQEYALLAEQVPKPPGRIEPERSAPSVERDRFFDPHPDRIAELDEVLDRAVVDIGSVVPAIG